MPFPITLHRNSRVKRDIRKTKIRRGTWKILFISHDAYQAGAQKCLLTIARWFIDHTDLEVKLLCLEGGKLLPEFDQLVETLLYTDISHLSSNDRIDRLIEFCEGSPDLIYANTVASGKAHSWLAKLGVPILTHVHELNMSIKRYAADWFDDILEHSDAYIACSGAVRRNLIEKYHVNKETCYTAYSFIQSSGIEPYRKNEKVKARRLLWLHKDKTLILGCGVGMPFRKGADLFIETAQKLIDMGEKQFHFYWIGGFVGNEGDPQYGNWSDYLKKLKNQELRDYVTFLGQKSDPREYLRAGDIFVLTSREDPFPLVVLEAADCGLPVICFEDAGGSPEFVKEDAGFVVPFEDTQEMAAKVSFLIHNEAVRDEMGTRARERRLNEITMERVMPEVLSASRKVAGKNPRISIIVPNYNHAQYLPQRLDSIFNQTYQDFEIYLMDDASTDNSTEILERYSDRIDVHLLANKENSGSPFKQWLKAFPLVRGDIIWIAESDDLCEPDFLEMLLPAFSDREVQIAYCASKIIGEGGEVQGDYTKTKYLESISTVRWKNPYCIPADQEINEALGIKNTILNISSVLFRNTKFDAEFEETIQNMHLGGDEFLILNVIKGGKVYFDPCFLNYHRRHETSIVGKVLSERGDSHLRDFFQDFYISKKYIASNFPLSPDFPERLEDYLSELWETLAPRRPFEDLKLYFPLDEIMELIRQNAKKWES
jgi:glycosyltransferase involved in cell wall biosynthesis